jgi:phage baseplate assembly protein W
MSTAETFDFSSVGDTLPTLRSYEASGADTTRSINYNPATPLRLSSKASELFVMNTNLGDAVSDNLRNLLQTNRGERVMQPDFGANLKAILTEYGTSGFENEVMARIKTSVKKYLPYVALSKLTLEKVESPAELGLVVVIVSVSYSIASAALTDQQVQVTLSTIA